MHVIVLLVVFYEWKMLFLKLRGLQCSGFEGMEKCRGSYIPVYVSGYYLILLLIVLSSIFELTFYREFLLAIAIIVLVFFLYCWPYE